MYKSNILPSLYKNKNNFDETPSKNLGQPPGALYPTQNSFKVTVPVKEKSMGFKARDPRIIPQYKRMLMLEEKLRLLENRNISDNEQLKLMIEKEYESRLKYPKYTIIKNTPLTSKEEIMNEILRRKFGPEAVYTCQYPDVIYKDQEEMEKKIVDYSINRIDNAIEKKMQDKKEEPKDENLPPKITSDMLYKLQKENFELRTQLANVNNTIKQMQEAMDEKMNMVLNKQKLTIESLRSIIEKGGSKKLKASMMNVLEGENNDLDKIEDEEEEFNKKKLKEKKEEKSTAKSKKTSNITSEKKKEKEKEKEKVKPEESEEDEESEESEESEETKKEESEIKKKEKNSRPIELEKSLHPSRIDKSCREPSVNSLNVKKSKKSGGSKKNKKSSQEGATSSRRISSEYTDEKIEKVKKKRKNRKKKNVLESISKNSSESEESKEEEEKPIPRLKSPSSQKGK